MQRRSQALGGNKEQVDGGRDLTSGVGSEPLWLPGKDSASQTDGLTAGARPGKGQPLAPRAKMREWPLRTRNENWDRIWESLLPRSSQRRGQWPIS